jgi:kynurenine formamidase
MASFVDLSIPVEHGAGRLGLEVSIRTPYTFENCNWQGSTVQMFCHYATHVDAPVHFIKGGDSMEKVPLGSLMGPAGLIELDDLGAAARISSDLLEDRGRHLRRGDIAILRTGWSDKHWGSDLFWSDGPYLAADAADWLVERGVKSVVYDFSEEYVVRNKGFRGEDCIVHHKILGNDIYNIEYVHQLGKIERPRLAIMALPLKLVGVDGAPARVIALEGDDLPSEFRAV